MRVDSLRFEGFRNLEDGEIRPCPGVNVIYGTNAQGKTNLLEAIWLLSGNRSFRGAKDSELVRFGSEFAKLHAEFFSEGRTQSAEIVYTKGKKEAFLNGVKQTGASALLGKLCAVVFSPEHLSLIKSGPAERRSFIDGAVCQIKPSYKDVLSEYKRTLAQRNTLLKDIPSHSELLDTLEAWDIRLASLGASIVRIRMKYVKRLGQCAARYHSGISNGREQLEVSYSSSIPSENRKSAEEARDYMLEYMKQHRRDDILAGFTTIGPHRDDIDIRINGESVRVFGSQGQQRSCVLSLKIAEEELIKLSVSEEPLVLLDDVLSELDSSRQEFLLNEIGDRQVFITCCEAASVERLREGSAFRVSAGRIESDEKDGENQ